MCAVFLYIYMKKEAKAYLDLAHNLQECLGRGVELCKTVAGGRYFFD